jgi:hypothetical protein
MLIDQIVESLPQTEYWGPESSLADVIEVIDQIVANPKLPAYNEKQADLDIIEKEIEVLEQTKILKKKSRFLSRLKTKNLKTTIRIYRLVKKSKLRN